MKKRRRWCDQRDDYLRAINFIFFYFFFFLNNRCRKDIETPDSFHHFSHPCHTASFLSSLPYILHTSQSHMGLKWVSLILSFAQWNKSIHIHHCGLRSLFLDTIIPKQWHLHKDFFSLALERLQIAGYSINVWLGVNYFWLYFKDVKVHWRVLWSLKYHISLTSCSSIWLQYWNMQAFDTIKKYLVITFFLK